MTTTKEPEAYVLDEVRERARQRLVAKRDFVRHLIVFIVVNGLVVATWMSVGGYFWPAWNKSPIPHSPITPRDIDAETLRQGDQYRR